MPRYFLDLPEEDAPLPWDPLAGPRPERADTRYFGGVFREMEAILRDREIDVYLTWDTERLPAYGERVVAVVLGDEVGQIPRYLGRVRAVFKCYGTRPVLGTSPVPEREPHRAPRARPVHRPLPAVAARRRRARPPPAGPAFARAAAPATHRRDPVGHLQPAGATPRPDRVASDGPVLRGQRRARATRSGTGWDPRRRALDARCWPPWSGSASHRPDLRADLRVTAGFSASESTPPADYSEALMNARVCLAPRGTSVETFRVFEGLRCGCVVVGERLPRHWFYDGSPVLQLDRWSELEDTLLPILDDPEELGRLHARSLAWWRDRCSERAVGRFLAERLNAL